MAVGMEDKEGEMEPVGFGSTTSSPSASGGVVESGVSVGTTDDDGKMDCDGTTDGVVVLVSSISSSSIGSAS